MLLSKQSSMAAPSPLIAYNHEKRLSAFITWLENRVEDGIWFHSNLCPVYIAQFGSSICNVPDQVIPAGTILSSTPKRWILSPRTVSSQQLVEVLASDECNDDLTPMMKLTIAYIFECCKGEASPWYGYLTTLNVPDVPYFWNADEVDMLKGTHAHEEHLLHYVSPVIMFLISGSYHRLIQELD